MTTNSAAPALIDAHCHLTDERLSQNAGAVIQRAADRGVCRIINCGTRPDDWPAVLDQAARFPVLISAIGVHPWFTANLPDDWPDRLAALLRTHPALAIGETGLDALHDPDAPEHAKTVFHRQVELAVEFHRPLVVHCVRAWAPLLETLKCFGPLPAGFMLHAFSGTPELIRELAPLNAWFSFSGAVTNPGNHRVHRAVREVPADRLLIETDAPDFLPHSISDRSQPNEPAHLPLVLRAVAALRACPDDAIADLTCSNARRLFRA